MKADCVVFSSCIPEVKMEGLFYKVDFGTVVLELTPLEAASLCIGILSCGDVKDEVFKSLNEGR